MKTIWKTVLAAAVLAASVFHYGRLTIVEVKQELAAAGFEVRGV